MNRYLSSLIYLMISTFTVSSVLISGEASAQGEKIAYVDVAKVFDGYGRTKNHDQVLRDTGKKKEEERDALVHDIRRLKDEIALLGEDAAASKRGAIDEKVRELQEFDMQTKKDLGVQRNEIVREIFQDIDDVVQRYGERKGFDLILNERVLLYRNPKYDITDEVLKELNKEYKNKK